MIGKSYTRFGLYNAVKQTNTDTKLGISIVFFDEHI